MPESIYILLGAFGAALLAIYLNSFVLKPVFSIDKGIVERIYDPKEKLWLYRLMVKNVGLRAANNCVGTMTIRNLVKENVHDLKLLDIERGHIVAVFRQADFTDIPADLEDETIPWCSALGERSLSLTINKQAIAKLLLFSVDENISRGGFPILLVEPSSEHNYRIGLIANTKYEGEIKVTANNANPRTISFSIGIDEKKQVTVKILGVEPKTKGRVLRQLLFGQ